MSTCKQPPRGKAVRRWTYEGDGTEQPDGGRPVKLLRDGVVVGVVDGLSIATNICDAMNKINDLHRELVSLHNRSVVRPYDLGEMGG